MPAPIPDTFTYTLHNYYVIVTAMSRLAITIASINDLDRIQDVWMRAMIRHEGEDFPEIVHPDFLRDHYESYRAVLNGQKRGHIYLGYNDAREAVAMAWIDPVHPEQHKAVTLVELYSAQAGYGAKMLARMEDIYCRFNSCKHIMALESRPQSAAFYDRLGYKSVQTATESPYFMYKNLVQKIPAL